MEGYLDVIADLKNQREVAMQNFREVDYLKNNNLADYFYNTFQQGQDVPYSLLDSIEENKFVPLPVVHGGAVITMKFPKKESGKLHYTTKWTSGSTLTYHYHSDCREKIVVKKGEVKIYLKGSVIILKEGDEIDIANNEGHQITALKQSELEVFFEKISNIKLKIG